MTDTTPMSPAPRVGRTAEPGGVPLPQYSRKRVLGTWAAAALPMGVLSWGVAPLLAQSLHGPTALLRALIVCITAGLVWQFVLVLALVRREQGTLRWPVLRDALWLRAPRNPRTGRRGGRLWWVLVPLVVAVAAEELIPKPPIPVSRDLVLFFGSDAGQSFMSGNWVWFAVLVVMWVFNTALGEELLFRGLLLPRMQGAFGRGDWLVNGALFAVYHLHVPWAIPQGVADALVLAYPSKRYRSALVGIAVHSAQTLVFTAVGLALVLG
jgi:membrane protease YdiL (CAAX protease family)